MPEDHRSVVRRLARPGSASTPVVGGIEPSVVYRAADADALDAQYEGRVQGFAYAREGHPNAAALAAKIDWMEGASGGVATSSGMAAVAALMLGLLRAGDHVVAADQLYGRSLRLLRQDLPRFGIAVDFADACNAGAVAAALRPETRMILVEVVSNPTLRVADMEGIARLAAERGVKLAVDNTFTTPRAYQPFAHGADYVLHSVTKMLSGHSDATLGWVAARDPADGRAIYDMATTLGVTASPFDCWLAERGLNTFELRYDRAEANAAALAEALAGMAGVAQVIYPGRADHPEHARAKALLGGRFGTMVSFRLTGGRAAANAFIRAAAHIPFAPTLGDVATLLSHPASSSHRGLTTEARAALGIDEGFIRVSVGIEDVGLLTREFAAAVAAAG